MLSTLYNHFRRIMNRKYIKHNNINVLNKYVIYKNSFFYYFFTFLMNLNLVIYHWV